jgi:putative hydrolases of HD superfamily
MPLLHNLQRGGGAWRENGISLDQVLAVNAVTGEVLPEVWDQVRGQVLACFDAMNSGGQQSD